MSSWQDLLSTEAKGQSAEQIMKHRCGDSQGPPQTLTDIWVTGSRVH